MKLERLRLTGGDVDRLTIPSRSASPETRALGVANGVIGSYNGAGWVDAPSASLFGAGPGPNVLTKGDSNAGYFGAVSQDDFIGFWDLANDLVVPGSFVTGYQNGLWLKYAYQGKTLFVAQQSIMTGVSWSTLYQLGIVYGSDDYGAYPVGSPVLQNKRVTFNDVTYRVRLITGSTDDPSLAEDGVSTTHPYLSESEWTKLIVPVTNGAWASYSNDAMGFINSGQTWCQESKSGSRLIHGVSSAFDTYFRPASDDSSFRGWRPVLEVEE